MANVNNMDVMQISNVLNQIVKMATGVENLQAINESQFISVAQTALLSGYDPMTQAISQVLSKTIFSARPYSQKFRAINVDNLKYGNHVRKLQTIDKEMENDDRLTLVDGESIDMYKVNKPKVVQTNWYGENQYQKSLTIYRDQLDTAFASSSEFQRFISMIMSNASDQIAQAKEETARMTLRNLIAGTMYLGNEHQIIDILAEYNDFAGTSLSRDTVFAPENFPNFVRWLYGFIQNVSDYMTERCAIYHNKIGENVIMRHTPKSDQRMYLYAPIVRLMETIVTSTTYHDEKTVFPSYEGVTYWQALTNPLAMNCNPEVVDSDGVAVMGEAVSCDNVIGILYDREAIGMTTVNEWAAATPFNARGGYYNHYWHFTNRYWNDFSENAIVFTLGPTPTFTSAKTTSTKGKKS